MLALPEEPPERAGSPEVSDKVVAGAVPRHTGAVTAPPVWMLRGFGFHEAAV